MSIDVVIKSVRALARDILQLGLQRPDGQKLPPASPGAHIDLHLPNGLVRQYSLTNAVQNGAQDSYEIAVGLDRTSRGGSRYVHEALRCGATLRISEPRNLFPLDASRAPVLLV